MSFKSVVNCIVGNAGKVVGILFSVFKSARPILEKLEPSIDAAGDALDFIEGNLDKIGTEADAFLDRNIQTVIEVEQASRAASIYFGNLARLMEYLRISSQETSPETITPEEFEVIHTMIKGMKESQLTLNATIGPAIESMKRAEAEIENS